MNFEQYMKAKHNGKAKAIKSQELESLFNCKGVQIREKVNELRSRGVPICSCNKGYYYSESMDDIKETIVHLDSRIKKIKTAESGMRKILNSMEEMNG